MSRKKQIALGLGISLTFILVLAGIKFLQISHAIAESQKHAPGPESVTSYLAKQQEWEKDFRAVGTVSPINGLELKAEEAGTVVKIGFESGSVVEAGSLLVQIDVSVEEAQLKGALARLEQSSKNLQRAKQLSSDKVMAIQNLEEAEATYQTASSEVRALEAIIAKKTVRAPFAGRAGIRTVNLGQYLQAGDPLLPLHDLSRVYVDFSLPQQALPALAAGQKVEFTVDAYANEKFTGVLSAINPQVDANTRNIKLQATAENPGERLRPGMFVDVRVVLPETNAVTVIPSSSISFAPYGDTVYVIEKTVTEGQESLSVRQQVVRTGEKRGEQVAILSGIAPGDEVVSSGTFKLRPGAKVVVNNNLKPGSSVSPNPEDT